MRSTLKRVFVITNFIFFIGSFNDYYLAETKKHSIINLFCLNNFREEMLKANIIYDEKIAKHTCECYLDEFSQTSSHQKAITKCKLEAQEKFNL